MRWLLLVLLIRLAGAQAIPVSHWQPERTWLLAVGVLEWQYSHIWPSFPKQNRRDQMLVEAMLRRGVPQHQVRALYDREATGQAVQAQVNELIARIPAGDTLVIYYAGHGYRETNESKFWMVPYDGSNPSTLWSLEDLAGRLEKGCKAERVMLIADCCFSGSLRLLARRHQGRLSFAGFSSSLARLSSTGNWTFSDAILDGIRGDPRMDRDHDGWVSLEELAHQVEQDMWFAEGQRGGGTGSTGFPLSQKWFQVPRSLANGEGQFVWVMWGGRRWKARVLERRGDQVKVRWVGLPQDYPDDWVPASDVTGFEMPTLPPLGRPRSGATR